MVRMLVFLLILAASAASYAQSNNIVDAPSAKKSSDQVEVITDQSGKTTINLKTQTLADVPAYKVIMTMSYAPAEKTILAHFEYITNRSIEYGDSEVIFALDGEPFFVAERPGSPNVPALKYKRERPRKPGEFSKYYKDGFVDCQFTLPEIQKLANGKEVGVRLGAEEIWFSQALLENMREFARECTRQVPTQKRDVGGKTDSPVSDAQVNKNTSGKVQEKGGSQVEVTTDKFSGKVTIRLKPQVLIENPNHKLTLEIKSELGAKAPTGYQVLDQAEERALLYFESVSNKRIPPGDEELHFLIDGKPLNKGKTPWSDYSHLGLPVSIVSGLQLPELRQIAAARDVQIRLGSIELTLSQQFLSNFRDFVDEFAKHAKFSNESPRKGGKP